MHSLPDAPEQNARGAVRGLDCVTFQSRVKPAIGILPYLEAQPHLHHLDEVISDWIEWQWVRGESVGLIADALSGLHFYWPEVRGHLRGAWRLFKQWRKNRNPLPCSAPDSGAGTGFCGQSSNPPMKSLSPPSLRWAFTGYSAPESCWR